MGNAVAAPHRAMNSRASFDQLVGAREQRGRHGEAKGLRSFQTDDKLESRWLLDRQVSRIVTVQNLHNVGGGTPPKIGSASAVTCQSAHNYKFPELGKHGQPIGDGEFTDL